MKKKIIIVSSVVILIIVLFIAINLCTNKTFLKNKYIGVQNQEIFIPKFSYFKDECCMTVATFYSLKSEKKLKKEVDNYMKDFEYFENENTYGYQKGELFIQSYEIVDNKLYRKIVIVY